MKTRGKDLDLKLAEELNKMILEGFNVSPISRSAIQKRLKQNSRSTFVVKHRAEMIENARIKQLHNAGLDASGKKKRNSLQDQIENLKEKNLKLEQERDAILEKLAMIINGIQAKGYNLEELMMPLRFV